MRLGWDPRLLECAGTGEARAGCRREHRHRAWPHPLPVLQGQRRLGGRGSPSSRRSPIPVVVNGDICSGRGRRRALAASGADAGDGRACSAGPAVVARAAIARSACRRRSASAIRRLRQQHARLLVRSTTTSWTITESRLAAAMRRKHLDWAHRCRRSKCRRDGGADLKDQRTRDPDRRYDPKNAAGQSGDTFDAFRRGDGAPHESWMRREYQILNPHCPA